jgi:hypothetical protein
MPKRKASHILVSSEEKKGDSSSLSGESQVKKAERRLRKREVEKVENLVPRNLKKTIE